MKIRLTAIGALLALLAPATTHALPIVSGGQLQGATDVNVGGVLYDVRFVDGRCVDVFDGCDEAADFTFQTYHDAYLASRALINQVFTGVYDNLPIRTAGCYYWYVCQAGIPYRVTNYVSTMRAINRYYYYSDYSSHSYHNRYWNTGHHHTYVWAVFTRADATVSEPATLALAGLGLGLMGALRRRRSIR